MTPEAITLLFREAREALPPFEGKPTDNGLTMIREMPILILMKIPYNQLGGIHSIMAILMDPTRYTTNHGGFTFQCPARLLLYDKNIANSATTVVRASAESAHPTRLNGYASYKAAEPSTTKFLRDTVDEVWNGKHKDDNNFYAKVSAFKIMAFLDANSGGLHTVDMLTLCKNMLGYYMQVDSIPQYINMLEDAQKRLGWRACPLPTLSLS